MFLELDQIKNCQTQNSRTYTAMFKIFIQNKAGSKIKNKHNEKTLEHLGSTELNRPYPFPYGFVLATTTDDSDNIDCFVFTQQNLRTNTIVECYVIGLLEIFEDDETDHKVIAVLPKEEFTSIDKSLDLIRKFYEDESNYFKIGDYLSEDAAVAFIEKYSDSRNTIP